MKISDRDQRVLAALRTFKQLTAKQVQELIFYDTSATPRDRTLHRLMRMGLILRLERRGPGGDKGGSGQYVYMLPKRLYRRAINMHTLAIVDCFLEFKRMERQGLLSIDIYSAEPDCWMLVGNIDVRPDLYIELTWASGKSMRLWLEVDQNTESRKQIRGKLDIFWKAYNAWTLPVFPKTIWVAVDAYRAKELSWMINQLPEEERVLYTVCLVDELSTIFV